MWATRTPLDTCASTRTISTGETQAGACWLWSAFGVVKEGSKVAGGCPARGGTDSWAIAQSKKGVAQMAKKKKKAKDDKKKKKGGKKKK